MTYKKKLIEVALPLVRINEESAGQKVMGAAAHPQNLHRWWARRPLPAARAVLFAQLVDDPSAHPERFPTEEDQALERKRLFDIIERLVPWEATNDAEVIAEAHAEIVKSCDGDLPNVLDPFGGGGAIPLESLRLGLPTFSGDLNPVAVLIQRAMLEIPHRFADRPPAHPQTRAERAVWTGTEGLVADVAAYGQWMREEAERRIGHLYPKVTLDDGTEATPIAWIWARTVESPDPSWNGHVPLVRSWVLAKKPKKPVVWIEPIVDRATQTIRYEIREGGNPPDGNVSRQGATCIATGAPMPFKYIRQEGREGRMSELPIAVVCESSIGRRYCPVRDADFPIPTRSAPSLGSLPDNPRDFKTPNYGISTWDELFTPRQLVALTTFSDLLGEVHEMVRRDAGGDAGSAVRLRDGGDGATAYADAVVTYLAFVIDKCADFWSSICSWNATNSQIRNTFARQAIPMTWDFAEANPFSGKLASWSSMLKGVVGSLWGIPVTADGDSRQRDACARIAEVGTCVVATDPPYYDNISYADLSDFFYVWLRRNLREVWPDECATLLTPKAEELIANRYRAGSPEAAKAHFELGMQGVFGAAAQHADLRFPATVFYAFKAAESDESGTASTGWETFLAGLLDAGFSITATWPIRTEKPGRAVAIGTSALASSVVLACRVRHIEAPMATRSEFVTALRSEMPPAIRLLQEQNIAPVDLAQSAIGPGIAVFSRYAKVVEADGSAMTVRAALTLVNEVLAEVLSGEEGEFDADSRFALTWFEQYGLNPAAFGEADVLARAKDTSVAGVAEAGIIATRDGKVRILERAELDPDWDPVADGRLTVWETTQHLIRALDASEQDAADLLRRLGPGNGERARQLAYLLYGICERKKWAEEAGAYNMLVTAWPEIERLAAATGAADDGSSSLF